VTAASRQSPVSRAAIASRIAAAVLGGYVFAWGVHALLMAAGVAVAMEFHDAEFVGAAVALLAYVAVFLWAFASPRLWRVWLVLVGGGAAMTALASWIQRVVT
jgi:hypothetical protein